MTTINKVIEESLKGFDEEIGKMIDSDQAFLEGKWEQDNLKSYLRTTFSKFLSAIEAEVEGRIKDHEEGIELCKSCNNLTMAVSHDGSIKALSSIQAIIKSAKKSIK